jgi:hypothetical protein
MFAGGTSNAKSGAMTFRPLAPLLLILCLATGCSSAPSDEAARQAWVMTKTSCSTYHYAIEHASFTGYGSRTTVQITNDVPTSRWYEASHLDYSAGTAGPPPKVVDETWIEAGADVGTHAAGEPARTMEGLYDQCERKVLTQDPDKNEITFSADATGALKECWFRPNACADDCAMGVTVSDFACGTLGVP